MHMRRFLTVTTVIMLFCVAFNTHATALFDEQSAALGVRELEHALPSEANEILGGMSVADATNAQGVFARLVENVGGRLRGIFASGLKNAAVIVVAAMLSGLVASVFPEQNSSHARLAGVLAVSAVSVANVNTFIGMGARVVDELSAFSKLLLPCMAAATAASGAVSSAAAKYAATMLFMDVLLSVLASVILPLIYAYAAAAVAEAAIGTEALAGVVSLIKWLARTIMTAIVIVFIVYISLTGVISGATDAAALRATKVAISTALPVVGTILADAAGVVLSGASILRGAVGVFGVLAVSATCLVPFLRLGVNYLLFKAASGLAATVADKSVAKLVDAFSTAFGLTLGLAGTVAMILFVSLVSMIRTIA